ncbi:DAK2 domain-containing protein [Streptomyces sp. NBC_00433]
MPPSLDAPTVRTWCRLTLAALGRAREEIDAINVFPVADGDTGTNLYLTVESAAQSVEAVFDAHATADPAAGTAGGPTLPEAFRAMSHGALIGARGNSGTILAQLLRGMNEPLAEAAGGPDANALRRALRSAADSAYEAVAHPAEGTMLTVASAAASAAEATVGDLAEVVRAAHTGARAALAATPGQLGVLRSAGVVDAGGLGLVAVLAALSDAVTGDTPMHTATTPGAGTSFRTTPPTAGAEWTPPAADADPTSILATGAPRPPAQAGGPPAALGTDAGAPAGTPPRSAQTGRRTAATATNSDPAGAPPGGRTASAADAGAAGAPPGASHGPAQAGRPTAATGAAAPPAPTPPGGRTVSATDSGTVGAPPGPPPGLAQAGSPPAATGAPGAPPGPALPGGRAPSAADADPVGAPVGAPHRPAQAGRPTAATGAGAPPAPDLPGGRTASAADAGAAGAPVGAPHRPAPAGAPGGAPPRVATAGGPEDCQAVGGPAYEVIYLLEAANAAKIARLRARLDRLGDSLVVVGGDGLWNVHVHVDDVGAAIEAGIEAGRPYRIRVTHFGEQVRRGAGPHERAIVAVVRGDGMAELCAQAGATVVALRAGEQLASGEIAAAIRRAHAREVILLPNDTELRHAAAAAVEQARADGVRVALIPTRSAVQGIAALAVHEPSRRFDEDVVAMTSAAGATRYAEVTVAERESWTMAGVCQAGDVLGLIDGDVAVIGADVVDTAVHVLDRMLAAGGEMVTLVLGATAPPGLAVRLESHVRDRHLAVDTVTYDGGQASCPLLIGVE